jgi:hypothetical protein
VRHRHRPLRGLLDGGGAADPGAHEQRVDAAQALFDVLAEGGDVGEAGRVAHDHVHLGPELPPGGLSARLGPAGDEH